ncbi:sensor domain-containing protein [Simplicispira psychrophila]|uniref:sensor domain-containing protein n=1 Tax=Simplicispira psychrophila TaxID=80882 RepID=UPI000AEB2697|nr:bifunctional diguanylate cyclase/phosphodiesterase [Simplicispira psychrophila]
MKEQMNASMDKNNRPPFWRPWIGLVSYLVIGALWVLVGEPWLADMAVDKEHLQHYQIWKGWLYVLSTGALAWWLLRRAQRAEGVRRLAEKKTMNVLRNAPAGIARITIPGQFLWANEQMLRMLDTNPEEVLGFNFREVVRAADRNWAVQQLDRLLAGEIDHYVGERECHRLSDGRRVPVLCTVTLVPALADEAAHLLCVLQDTGPLHAARAALARSETRLQLALEASGSGVWDWDMLQRQCDFSPGMARMLRYTGDNLSRDFRFEARLHDSERASVVAGLRRAMASGGLWIDNMRLLCYDGTYRWFMARGQCVLGAQGQTERFSGVLTDMSDERDAQERQRLASTVVDNTTEGVLVTDAHSRILSANAAVTRLLGYTESELLGKTPNLFKSGRHDIAFYSAMWATMAVTGRWQGEIWNRRKNGEIFPEHMSLSAVRDETGTVTHYVCMFSDISEEKAQQKRLDALAQNDPLTGLSNRSWFIQQLDAAVQQATASGEMLAVLQLNLDRFKDVNDSYGHAAGDAVLKHIALQVHSALRPGDLLGRMAGDEMAVVVRHLRHPEGAAAVARQLLAAVAVPWCSPDGFEVVAGASVGICMFPTHAASAQALLQGAHAAVYGAKARGRGAWCFFHEEMTQAARERLELEARLRQAMAQGHLSLHYQPQVDIASDRIVGAEALLRWHDPQEGWISPVRFIPVAESSGIIGPLGEWVLETACRQGRLWLDAGLAPVTIAINVSPRQFHLTDLVDCVSGVLSATGFPANRLELEITESALAEQPEEALKVLRRMGDLGLRLAVDDFGTGYSSLAHLKRFPIDVLKIDQSFIREIPQSADDMAISAAIIAMGQSMGLEVLAEGVETPEQLAFLRARGCHSYQGYLRSRPLPAAEFAVLLQAQKLAPV